MPAHGFGVSFAGEALGGGDFGELEPGMTGEEMHQTLPDDAEDAGAKFLAGKVGGAAMERSCPFLLFDRTAHQSGRADARAASLRVKGVANPDDHFGFRGERQNFRVKNFCACGSKGVGFVVAQLVQEPGFGGFVRVGGIDTVHVSPDDEFFGVHDVSDDSSRKIGTVATEGSDAAVGRGADETGDDGDDAVLEQREKDGAAALARLFEVRLGVAEIVAGQDKVRGRDGHGGDSGFFQRGGEKARTEAFSKGGEAIEELGIGSDAALRRDFVKQISAEKLEFAANAEIVVGLELQIVQDFEVKLQQASHFAAGVSESCAGESVGDGKKMIGDALHGRDDDRDLGAGQSATDQTCGVEHALRAEQRAATKLEGHDI
jgi:hypothetical protein